MTYRGKSKKFRHAAMLFTLLLGAREGAPAQSLARGPADQQKFFGKWKLNETQSKVTHSGDDKSIQWRSYERDGDRVKVSWGNAEGRVGSYSAKCDNSLETTGFGRIRCRQVALDTIEGEQFDKTDRVHRYYRRVVSPDGKILTITWYAEAKRSRETDRFIYTKVSHSPERLTFPKQ